MKFFSFIDNGDAAYGALHDGDMVSDLRGIAPGCSTLKEAIENLGLEKLLQLAGAAPPRLALASLRLLPPISTPEKIICIGLNYRAHAAEGNFKLPQFPSTFLRLQDTLVASGQSIVLPPASISTHMDFEGELAVIIGKEGRFIAAEEALDHVFGYSCFNDGSIRDFQFTHSLAAGKNFPSTGGFGPCITSAEEINDPSALVLTTRLNGTPVQHQSLDDMIFNVPSLIEYVSSWTILRPGDVIATGTPAGVGFARQPPLWMREGDVIEVEISGIGILSNDIKASSQPATPRRFLKENQ